ncbi:hypothetical protein ILUMI_12614 [Ignelater luminosus]|uniref:UDP-glycosyltransferase n=1 Tax=Ignelater luminosus TaxID=2038154 RepID=A0A8K0D2G8_IGNLU|nr:hypothetical protein ILUMI_12614 [Ignelater luminosus]
MMMMKKKIVFLIVYVIFNILKIDGAKILGIALTPSFSHQVAFRPLWSELSLRGHQLVVITTDPMNDASLTNLTEIDLQASYEIFNKEMIPVMNRPEKADKMFEALAASVTKMVDEQLGYPEVQKLIENKSENFDLIIAEVAVPFAIMYSERFKCPYIGIMSMDVPTFMYNLIGNPVNPITNPDVNLPYIGKLSFFQRFSSITHNLVVKWVIDGYLKTFDEIAKRHFGESVATIPRVMSKMSLLFDLQEHLDNASQGVIYFSLGGNVRSKYLSNDFKAILLETFSELPYKILWKFELEDLPGKPDNVIISKWFPQQDVFKHPNIKLFITQGGIQSLDEAIYDHIPILGLPIFLDQLSNIQRMVNKGLGLSLDYKTLDKQTFKETILEIINNPKYRNRVKEVADLARDQPMTGLAKAVWWTEYVIRHKGAKHLRSPLLEIPSYQYYLLDVIAFCHQVAFYPLWRELSLKGHEVVLITTNPIKDTSLTNLTEIDLHFMYKEWANMDMNKMAELNLIEMFNLFNELGIDLTDKELRHPEVQKIINNETEHFDVVLAEGVFPGMVLFAERFKCPLIQIFSLEAPSEFYYMFGNPIHPVLNPDFMLPFFGQLTFTERLLSTMYVCLSVIFNRYIYFPEQQAATERHFGKSYPNIEQIISNASLMFVNTDFVSHAVRPLLPNVIQIGGGTHLSVSKPLPKDLQTILDKATNGVIYFSLGSNVKSKDLSETTRKIFLETFAELPFAILWKFEEDDLPKKPDNVFLSKWFPQQDIFKHPNIKLFITQGGVQSMEEAIYDHIPMLGLPFFMDQPTNVKRMVAMGLGLSLDYKTLDKETFKETIQEIINNPKYRSKVKELADLASDQPMTGLEKAVWWTEYVIRHKGARHLRSPLLDIPSYQYYLLDVIGFCLGIIIVAIWRGSTVGIESNIVFIDGELQTAQQSIENIAILIAQEARTCSFRKGQ